MRRKLFLGLMLSAWLLATGCPCDLVQVFGWGRMITTYSQSMSFCQAVEKTFSGDTLCGVCEWVQDTRQHQEQSGAQVPGNKVPDKIVFVCAPRALVLSSPASHCVGLVTDESVPASAERPAPPLPPPRSVA